LGRVQRSVSLATIARNGAKATIDAWMTAVLADKSNAPLPQKRKCDQLFPYYADSRIAAGGPLADDIFKCQLKPVDVKDYKVAPTADQVAQLQKAFPGGVCDYTKPGVGKDAKLTTWAAFKGDGTFVGL
jgi:uncharacterized tannase-like protein DUF6351